MSPIPPSTTDTRTVPFAVAVRRMTRLIAGGILLEGLECVHQQVERDLLQLDPVAEHAWPIGRRLDDEGNAARQDVALQHLDDLVDAVVEVDRCVLGRILPQERAQAPHHLGGALVVRHDVGECGAQLREVGHGRGDQARGGLCVGHDGRERLVDFVRQGPGQRRQRRHAPDVRELVAQLPRLLLRPAPLGDVAHDGEDLVDVAADDARFEEADFARDRERVLERGGVVGAHRPIEAEQKTVGHLRRQHLLHVLAEEVFRRRGETLAILGVKVEEHATGAQDEDPVGQRAEDGAVRGLGLLARGDVLGDREHAALAVDFECVGGIEHRDRLAVLLPPPHFAGSDAAVRLELGGDAGTLGRDRPRIRAGRSCCR